MSDEFGVSERLRMAMAARRKRTSSLSQELGFDRQTMYRYRLGRSVPTLKDLNRIADNLNVSRVWLTHGEGVMEVNS
jgi:transcriptional regulator with XRE-family HTH domain